MKKIFGILAAVVMGMGVFTGVPVNATSGVEIIAAECPSNTFLGFYPWYSGLECDRNGSVKAPSGDKDDTYGLPAFIWTIVLNVLADLTLAIGYIMIIVFVWGGFYMITSNGDPGKVAKARKILTAGVAGSLIGIFASVIAHAIISIL